MFDNACKYNESDSQIYKDAQTLQRLAHQTVRHLTEDGDGVPDARAAVQDILGQYCVVLLLYFSVADPGCLSRIRIFSIPDLHQRI